MATKSFKEFKDLSRPELLSRIRSTEADYFKLRMEHETGQLEKTANLWKTRKSLARMKMLVSQQDKKATLVQK